MPDALRAVVKSEVHNFRVETIASGLANPWGMVLLPDGRILVTERIGRLRVIENGQLLPDAVRGIPEVWARGQGGLLDIALHPDYAQNGWIYLAYSKPLGEGALTEVVRGRLKDGAWVDPEVIFAPPESEATTRPVHFGCRIVFDGKGYVYFSIGDRGDKLTPENNAQRLDNVKGKVHRLHDDGRVPEDNPFVGRAGAAASIWSYGNRNAQGLAFQPGTQLLWETEHGPRGGDELNIIRKGFNYGWPVVSFGINYNGQVFTEQTQAPGFEPPVIHWTPSIAVCGIAFYTGDRFPKWKGNLFAAALAQQQLVRVVIDAEKVTHQEVLLKGSGRIRDVRSPGDGHLYLVYDEAREGGGSVVRLVPE